MPCVGCRSPRRTGGPVQGSALSLNRTYSTGSGSYGKIHLPLPTFHTLINPNPNPPRRTYFDPERVRTDPVVSLNVLSLFYSLGRGHELASTLDWVLGVLTHSAYLDLTRYYETAESFLFFAARLLCTAHDDAALQTRLAPLLRGRVLAERAGYPGDALALAMRVLAGAILRRSSRCSARMVDGNQVWCTGSARQTRPPSSATVALRPRLRSTPLLLCTLARRKCRMMRWRKTVATARWQQR